MKKRTYSFKRTDNNRCRVYYCEVIYIGDFYKREIDTYYRSTIKGYHAEQQELAYDFEEFLASETN